MMRQSVTYIFSFWFCLAIGFQSIAQESIFTGLKGDYKKADAYYQNHEYHNAIVIYKQILEKDPNNTPLILDLANSYFFTNNMENASRWYREFDKRNGQLTSAEELRFASSLHSSGNYQEAIVRLQRYQERYPADVEISKKIWQLQNVHFLMEDSLSYHIERLPINSSSDESGPLLYGNSLVFISNRDDVSLIKRVDARNGSQYYSWYASKIINQGSTADEELVYGKSLPFAAQIKSKYHKGSISFNDARDVMIYSKVIGNVVDGEITSKLFFAEKIDSKWSESISFALNNENYSIQYPFLTNNGKRIYFSSNMPGGFGGMDLYYADFIKDAWSKPINLGKEINTSQNEGHPFVYGSILYFSSDGHPGLGGLDLFHVNLDQKPLEVINAGYPVNTFHDDFNLILDESGTAGYFCSNREHALYGGDDIYSIQFKKLTFPLRVSGKISFKKIDLVDNGEALIKLSNASIELIDKDSEEIVYESKTDISGNFEIDIPYESKFLLKVKQPELGIAIVSMEIPKNHRDYLNHDIVIVQDLFNITPK